MIRRPPRPPLDRSSAASDVYKRQMIYVVGGWSGDYAEVNEHYQAGFRTFLPASPR